MLKKLLSLISLKFLCDTDGLNPVSFLGNWMVSNQERTPHFWNFMRKTVFVVNFIGNHHLEPCQGITEAINNEFTIYL